MQTLERDADGMEKETGRIEAFSDGVFSIAITLLVLELKVPQLPHGATSRELWMELGRLWPSYFSFVTSFFTILIMWAYHHGIFKLIRRNNARLMFANGFVLLLVTAVPFPTALIAQYLRTPAASAACAVYAGLFVVIANAYGLLILAARKGGTLLKPGVSAEVSRRLRDCYLVGLPSYLAATIAAPFSPWLSLAICTALWIFWSCASIERGSASR